MYDYLVFIVSFWYIFYVYFYINRGYDINGYYCVFGVYLKCVDEVIVCMFQDLFDFIFRFVVAGWSLGLDFYFVVVYSCIQVFCRNVDVLFLFFIDNISIVIVGYIYSVGGVLFIVLGSVVLLVEFEFVVVGWLQFIVFGKFFQCILYRIVIIGDF